ncbi:MAG: nuclear transport factor 2 family protein [Mycobacteriaceae bacterium]|nr:nuclear transport factor 2 family protein [Mycobacteriaceae bacterium]
MTMTYQQQYVLDGLGGRAAILNLTARHDRLYSAGDVAGWIATFRHAGATYVRGGESFSDLRAAFDGGKGQRLVTVDHEISVDGVDATQNCVALLFKVSGAGTELQATGTYRDRLGYERGGWYFTSRELNWDLAPRKDVLAV